MKTIGIYSVILLLTTCLSACGIGTDLVTHHPQNSTAVHLSGNNFKVTDQVRRKFGAVLFMGNWRDEQKGIVRKCVFDDDEEIPPAEWFKIVIDVMTEEHFSGFAPFFVRRTITASEQVVE